MIDTYLDAPPYGPAFAGRGLLIVRQVLAKLNASAWAGKNISAARWTYRLRAWDEDDTSAHLVNEEIAKSTTDDTTGWLDDYVACGSTVRDTLLWQIVEVDGDNTDAATPSGQRELVLESWRQPILAATVTGATDP